MGLPPLHRKELDSWQVGDYPIGMVRYSEGWVPLIIGGPEVREWLEQANLSHKAFKTRRELHQAITEAIEIHPGLTPEKPKPHKKVEGGYLLTGGIMATRATDGRWDLHHPDTGKSYPKEDTLRLAASAAAGWHRLEQNWEATADGPPERKPLSSFQIPIAA